MLASLMDAGYMIFNFESYTPLGLAGLTFRVGTRPDVDDINLDLLVNQRLDQMLMTQSRIELSTP